MINNLPAYDKCRVDTARIFSVIFKHSWWHSILLHFLGDSGSPKYLMGKLPSENPVMFNNFSFVEASTPSHEQIRLFNVCHQPSTVWEVWHRLHQNICTEEIFPLQKIIKSSAKMRLFILSLLHIGWNLKFGNKAILFNTLDKYSTMTNKRGDIDHPVVVLFFLQNTHDYHHLL